MKSQKWGFPNVFQIASYILFGLLIFTQFYIILPSQKNMQQIVYTIITSIILFSLILSFSLTQLIDSLDDTIKKYYLSITEGKLFDTTNFTDYCDICDSFVKSSSKHCKRCDRCTSGFDHHCKWLNKCVGEHNYSISEFIHGDVAVVYISTVAGLLMFSLDFNLVMFHIWINYHHLTTYQYILKTREQAKKKIELAQLQQKQSQEARLAIEGEPSNNATKIKGQGDDLEDISKDQSNSEQESRKGEDCTPNQQSLTKTQGIQLKEDSIKIQTDQQQPQSIRSIKSVKISSKNNSKLPEKLEPQFTLPKFLRMNLVFEDMKLENIIDPSIKGEYYSCNRANDINKNNDDPLRKISWQSAKPPSAQRRQANNNIFQEQISQTVPIPHQISSINEEPEIHNKQQPGRQKQQNQLNLSPVKEQISRLGFQSSLEHSQIGIGSQLYDSQMIQQRLASGIKKSLVETATTSSIQTPRKLLILNGDKSIKSFKKGSSMSQTQSQNYLETNFIGRENNRKDDIQTIELTNIVNLDQSSLPMNLIHVNDASILETEQYNIPPKINEQP